MNTPTITHIPKPLQLHYTGLVELLMGLQRKVEGLTIMDGSGFVGKPPGGQLARGHRLCVTRPVG